MSPVSSDACVRDQINHRPRGSGGAVAFERVRPTSDLWRPEFHTFLAYSRMSFDARKYTNDGPVNRELEAKLARYHDVDRCVTFSSGFWGLILAMKALAISSRDEVIMPSITYRRLADAAAWAGLTPHFADVDPGNPGSQFGHSC